MKIDGKKTKITHAKKGYIAKCDFKLRICYGEKYSSPMTATDTWTEVDVLIEKGDIVPRIYGWFEPICSYIKKIIYNGERFNGSDYQELCIVAD